MLACLVTMFTRFHVKLMYANKTTIENLELKSKGHSLDLASPVSALTGSTTKAPMTILKQFLEPTPSGTLSLCSLNRGNRGAMESTGPRLKTTRVAAPNPIFKTTPVLSPHPKETKVISLKPRLSKHRRSIHNRPAPSQRRTVKPDSPLGSL
jgi:hypothetical protein